MSDGVMFLPLLALLALPLGLLLTSGLAPARILLARVGTAALAGIGVLVAVVHALACLGVAPRMTLPILAGVSLLGSVWWLVRARPFAGWSGWRSLVLSLLAAAMLGGLLAYPFLDVRDRAVHEHDATHIWAQKAVRALDQAPPDLVDETVHFHPEYPRGLGILTAAVAMPHEPMDPRLPRAVPLLLFALTLLCALDVLSCRGSVTGGFAAMAICASIPMMLRGAANGLADAPLAGFVLLATAGLALGRGGPSVLATLAGAAGAMVIKDEGTVFCGAVMLVLVVKLVRARRLLGAIGSLAVIGALAAPWIILKTAPDAGTPHLSGSYVENAGLILLRCEQMLKEIAHLTIGSPDPSLNGYVQDDVLPGGDLNLWVALACGLVLLIGRGGRIPVLPVGLLLTCDFVAIVLSHQRVEWQLITALTRLVIHVTPVLVVAAIEKVTAPPEGAAREVPEAAAA